MLDDMGASLLLPVGRPDDGRSTTEEGDYMEWKEHLFSLSTTKFGYQERIGKHEPTIRIFENDISSSDTLQVGFLIQKL